MPPRKTAALAPESLEELDAYWRGPARSPYIVSRRYDWLCFLLPPLLALALGVWASRSSLAHASIQVGGEQVSWQKLLLGILIHAHLLAVVFRSHANRSVFTTFPLRYSRSSWWRARAPSRSTAGGSTPGARRSSS